MLGRLCVFLVSLLWIAAAGVVGTATSFLAFDVGHEFRTLAEEVKGMERGLFEEWALLLALTVATGLFAFLGPFFGMVASFFWRNSGKEKPKGTPHAGAAK